jgi:hypothetical protein
MVNPFLNIFPIAFVRIGYLLLNAMQDLELKSAGGFGDAAFYRKIDTPRIFPLMFLTIT